MSSKMFAHVQSRKLNHHFITFFVLLRLYLFYLFSRCVTQACISSCDREYFILQHESYLSKRSWFCSRLNLSNNDLSTETAVLFADSISENNTITHLDVSWNKLYSPAGIHTLCFLYNWYFCRFAIRWFCQLQSFFLVLRTHCRCLSS